MPLNRVTLIVVGLAVATQSACAHQAGKGAGQGAVEQVAKTGAEQQAQGKPPIATTVVSNAVRGGLDQLSQPEQLQQVGEVFGYAFGRGTRAALGQLLAPPGGALASGREGVGGSGAAPQGSAIQQIAAQAATAFAAAFSQEAAAQLGPQAEGPLAQSLAAASERISGAAVRGAAEGFATAFPECSGPDREQCVQQRIRGMSRTASEGVADAVLAKLRPYLFALGALVALVFALAVIWGIAVLRRLGPLRAHSDQPARS